MLRNCSSFPRAKAAKRTSRAISDMLMGNKATILRRARWDPELNISDLERLAQLPSDVFVSEWRFTRGRLRYEYHYHQMDKGIALKECFESGMQSMHPALTGVYSKNDFIEIARKYKLRIV